MASVTSAASGYADNAMMISVERTTVTAANTSGSPAARYDNSADTATSSKTQRTTATVPITPIAERKIYTAVTSATAVSKSTAATAPPSEKQAPATSTAPATTTTVITTTTVPTTTAPAVVIEAPAATEILRANFVGGVLQLKWKPVACESYMILYRVRGTTDWSTASDGFRGTEFTLKGLAGDTCYQTAVIPIRKDNSGNVLKAPAAVKDVINHVAVNYAVPKAMWLPCFTLEPMMKGKTAAQFTENFRAACLNAKSLGVNTLYVHVRAFSDAFYQSEIYPWSRYCSGTVGASPGYDPLSIMIDVAHRNGLSIHAWINPYRADFKANLDKTPGNYLVKQWYSKPNAYMQYVTYAEDYGSYWLNPGYPAVRELIFRGAEEIVSHYNIDGIHIDDYFYPTTESSFDNIPYASYNSGMKLEEWRLSNCTATVKGLYDTVKAANPSALFGIAPQGNYDNNYAYMYADVGLWLSKNGYCDYIMPQVYFGYEHKYKPFKETVQSWTSLKRSPSVKLYIGIAPANLWLNSEYENRTGIIGDQIKDSFALGASGVALYSYDSLFAPPDGKKKRASDEIAAVKAALK